MSDLLSLSPLDPIYRANFADGSVLCVRSGREAMAEEVRRTYGPREAAAFAKFADWLDSTGAGNSPVVLKILAAYGKDPSIFNKSTAGARCASSSSWMSP